MPEQIRTLDVFFNFPYSTLAEYADTLPKCTTTQEPTMTQDLTTLRPDQLIGVYRKLRERRDIAKKEFTESQKPTLDLMDRIESEVQRRLDESGLDSFKGDTGTAYRVLDTSVTVQDRSAFMDYVIQKEEFDLMDVRASKTAVVAFVEEYGELPPGLSMKQSVSVNFQAPRRG